MHSWNSRVSAIFSYACGVLLVAMALNSASHYVLRGTPSIHLNHVTLYKMGSTQLNTLHHTGELHAEEHGTFIHFNLTADFTPAWTWNTHQLFVMVVAEFETHVHKKNQVVIWDEIITSREKCIISLPKQSPDYAITDNVADLSNLKVSLTVKYDVIPIAGPWSLLQQGGFKSFTLPAKIASLPVEKDPRRFYAPNTRPF